MRALTASLFTAALLSSAPGWAQSSEDEAGDISEIDKADRGPLRDRIAPVSSHQFLKKGRLEISPSASATVRDAFFTKYIFGGTLTYHASETFAFGLRAGYSIPTVAPTAQECTPDGCHRFTFTAVDGRAPGQILLIGGLDAEWAPIYGKLAILSERFLHFDLYGIAGASFVEYGGPKGNDLTQPTPRLWTVGGNVGAGARVFANRFMAVRLELRDLIYVENVTAIAGSATSLRNQLLFELGLSFFIPPNFGEP